MLYQQHNAQVRCILIGSVSVLTSNLAADTFRTGQLFMGTSFVYSFYMRVFVPLKILDSRDLLDIAFLQTV